MRAISTVYRWVQTGRLPDHRRRILERAAALRGHVGGDDCPVMVRQAGDGSIEIQRGRENDRYAIGRFDPLVALKLGIELVDAARRSLEAAPACRT